MLRPAAPPLDPYSLRPPTDHPSAEITIGVVLVLLGWIGMVLICARALL